MKEDIFCLEVLILVFLIFWAAKELKDFLCLRRDERRIRKFLWENGIDKKKLKKSYPI